jgi:hypothetical protein
MSEQRPDPDGTNAPRDRRFSSDEILLLYRIRRSTGWMAFFTMVIAIGIAAGAYLFWQQLTVAQDQLDQMEDLSDHIQKTIDALQMQSAASEKTTQDFSDLIRQSIDATNRQADASQKATEIAINGQMALERPWVGIESVAATHLAPNQTFALKAIIRNTGRSPALNVRAILYAAAPAAKDVAASNITACDSCHQPIILPNGSVSYDVAINSNILTKEKIDHVNDGTDVIILFGRVDYTDSAKRPHTTTSCMRYAPKRMTFDACDQGNRLD